MPYTLAPVNVYVDNQHIQFNRVTKILNFQNHGDQMFELETKGSKSWFCHNMGDQMCCLAQGILINRWLNLYDASICVCFVIEKKICF